MKYFDSLYTYTQKERRRRLKKINTTKGGRERKRTTAVTTTTTMCIHRAVTSVSSHLSSIVQNMGKKTQLKGNESPGK